MNESPTNPADEGAVTEEAKPSSETTAAEPPAKPEPPPPMAPPPVEPPLAPGVPRLSRPGGTAKGIPETILGPRPSPIFLAVVSIASLASDIVTKLWAEKKLEGYPGYVNLIENHLMLVLAKNKGG